MVYLAFLFGFGIVWLFDCTTASRPPHGPAVCWLLVVVVVLCVLDDVCFRITV